MKEQNLSRFKGESKGICRVAVIRKSLYIKLKENMRVVDLVGKKIFSIGMKEN